MRRGQSLFNLAYAIFPAEVSRVQVSQILGDRKDVDPYYDDANCERFIVALAEELKKA